MQPACAALKALRRYRRTPLVSLTRPVRKLSPAAEQLVGELKSPDFMVRLGAVESLGKLGNAETLPDLIQSLSDPYEGVRWQASLALGKLGDIAAVEPLMHALSDKKSSVVRAGAAEALGVLSDRRAIEPLKNAIDQEDTYSAFAAEESREKVKKALRTALENIEKASWLDERDGKRYRIAQFGAQVVMIENLAYKPTSGRYWTYKDWLDDDAKYGFLYSRAATRTVSPPGWHLPTSNEWQSLFGDVVSKLPYNEAIQVRETLIARFDPLFAGWRFSDGTFHGRGVGAHFWEDVGENPDYESTRYFDRNQNSNGASLKGPGVGEYACSVRLFKDR
jgi:uncharacterized protein (TIGR02145 family)